VVEVRGNDIYRAGVKIGWLNQNRLYDRTGKELGYFTSDAVYDVKGERLARIEGDYVYAGGKRIELEQVIHGIAAIGLSDAARVAVSTFLGV